MSTHTAVTARGPAVISARGGVSVGTIFTGVLVAFGAMFLLSTLVAGVLSALGYLDGTITEGEAIEMGVGAGIALVVAQFLAYMWGGYTAGRMGRGSGVANGLAVPFLALVLAGVVGGIAAALGAEAYVNLPFQDTRLPVEENYLVNWGVGIGIASLIAMFLGGVLGGAAGARWHSKLEEHALAEGDARTIEAEHDTEGSDIDLREGNGHRTQRDRDRTRTFNS